MNHRFEYHVHGREKTPEEVIEIIMYGLTGKSVTTPEELNECVRFMDAENQSLLSIYCAEMLTRHIGVVMHMERDIAQDLMLTDIDAATCDLRMPYPSFELTIPQGIAIPGTDYELSSMLIVEPDEATKALNGCAFQHEPQIQVLGNIRKHGDRSLSSNLPAFNLKMEKGKCIEEVLTNPDNNQTSLERTKAMRASVRVAVGTLLYIMSVEETSLVLRPMPAIPHIFMSKKKRRRHPERVKENQAQKHYELVDITEKSKPETKQRSAGTHASPKGHWRKGHMRVLRHRKYIQVTGQVRIVWVRPTWVGQDGISRFVTQRKVPGSPAAMHQVVSKIKKSA
tara:strand:- start:2429 stop:3445 length:1017 start_codon:yes stop_codon:yes gene_type:complete